MSDEFLYIGGERVKQLSAKELLDEHIRLRRPIPDDLRQRVDADEKSALATQKLRADLEKDTAERKAILEKRRADREAAEIQERREAMRLLLEPLRRAELKAWIDAGGEEQEFSTKVWPERAISHAMRIAAEEDSKTRERITNFYVNGF